MEKIFLIDSHGKMENGQERIGDGSEGEVGCGFLPCQYFAVGLVRSGSAVLIHDGVVVPVSAPAIIILDERTRPSIRSGLNLRFSTLYFNPAYVNDSLKLEHLRDDSARQQYSGTLKQDFFLVEPFVKAVWPHGIYSIIPTQTERFINLFEAVSTQIEGKPDKFWPCRGRSFLIELLFQMRLLQLDTEPVLPLPLSADDPCTTRMGKAISYVQDHYQQNISLTDLARVCATNRTTLNTEFRVVTGMTVRAYTIALRIKLAAAWLRDTGLPVNEIMERVGYGNQSHFTRAFRQIIGDTPGAYRDTYRGRRKAG